MKDTIIVIRKLTATEVTSSAKGVERLAVPLSGVERTEYDRRRNHQGEALRQRGTLRRFAKGSKGRDIVIKTKAAVKLTSYDNDKYNGYISIRKAP